jgi:hypothetical protein
MHSSTSPTPKKWTCFMAKKLLLIQPSTTKNATSLYCSAKCSSLTITIYVCTKTIYLQASLQMPALV